MDRIAATSPFGMATTWIISTMVIFTIRTQITWTNIALR